MTYQPEIGQMAFGQPWQSVTCPEHVEDVLDALKAIWYVTRDKDACPFRNSAARYNGKAFQAHAYSWSEEEQPFNFAWRDVRVSWYKRLGRGMSINREVGLDEAKQMLRECAAELLGDAVEE